jgi:hypothetical protein
LLAAAGDFRRIARSTEIIETPRIREQLEKQAIHNELLAEMFEQANKAWIA